MPTVVNNLNTDLIDREEASFEERVMRAAARRDPPAPADQRVPRPRNPDGEKSDGLR